MKTHERLKYIRKELNLTQKEVSEILGVAPTTYAMIETGRRTLKAGYVKLLKYQFNVNEDWLFNGEGEPFYVSPQNSQLLERFERMSPGVKAFFFNLSEQLLSLEESLKKEES